MEVLLSMKIVCFSSTTFHRSGANTTNKMRRSGLIQFSSAPSMNKEGTGLFNLARRFLKDGEKVLEDDYPLLDPEEYYP